MYGHAYRRDSDEIVVQVNAVATELFGIQSQSCADDRSSYGNTVDPVDLGYS